MPTQPLSHLSFDAHSRTLSFIAGDRLFTDVREVRIARPEGGGEYTCDIVLAGEHTPLPVPATCTPPQVPATAGRATGCTRSVAESITKYFARQSVVPPRSPSAVPSALDETAAKVNSLAQEQARAVLAAIDRHLGRPLATAVVPAAGAAPPSVRDDIAKFFGCRSSGN